MFTRKTIFSAFTAASLMAGPVLALDMIADEMLVADPEDMTILRMTEASAFVGNEVRTKDQIRIGRVERVLQGGQTGSVALVSLQSDIAAKSSVKTFTVPLSPDVVVDGSLTLGWTEAELFATLSSQLVPTSTN